jgi:hypothetical protein
MRLFIRISAVTGTNPAQLDDVEWLLLDRQGVLVSQGAGDAALLDRRR